MIGWSFAGYTNYGTGSCPYAWPPYGPPGVYPPVPPGQVTPVPPAAGQATPVPPDDSVTPPPPDFPLSNPQSNSWVYGRATDQGYPWSDTRLHALNYPTPGMFFDVGNPQGRFVFKNPEQLYRAYLGSVLRMAGMDPSLATSQAGAEFIQRLSDLTTGGQYNDAMFGTTTVNLAGGRKWIGPHGRGINWDARHAPVHRLVGQGKRLYRTTKLDGTRLQDHMEAKDRPVIWLPAIDLKTFVENRRLIPAKWQDGSSAQDPPRAFAIDLSGVQFPGGVGSADHTTSGDARDWWERR